MLGMCFTWPDGFAATSFIALLLISSRAGAGEMTIIGSPESDELLDSPARDVFYGGRGADLYIKRYLHDEPDLIVDFNPEEGDQIELRLQLPKPQVFRSEQLSINRKGIVSWQLLDGQRVPLLGVNRSDLTVEMDKRKGRVFLKFKADL